MVEQLSYISAISRVKTATHADCSVLLGTTVGHSCLGTAAFAIGLSPMVRTLGLCYQAHGLVPSISSHYRVEEMDERNEKDRRMMTSHFR